MGRLVPPHALLHSLNGSVKNILHVGNAAFSGRSLFPSYPLFRAPGEAAGGRGGGPAAAQRSATARTVVTAHRCELVGLGQLNQEGLLYIKLVRLPEPTSVPAGEHLVGNNLYILDVS